MLQRGKLPNSIRAPPATIHPHHTTPQQNGYIKISVYRQRMLRNQLRGRLASRIILPVRVFLQSDLHLNYENFPTCNYAVNVLQLLAFSIESFNILRCQLGAPNHCSTYFIKPVTTEYKAAYQNNTHQPHPCTHHPLLHRCLDCHVCSTSYKQPCKKNSKKTATLARTCCTPRVARISNMQGLHIQISYRYG